MQPTDITESDSLSVMIIFFFYYSPNSTMYFKLSKIFAGKFTNMSVKRQITWFQDTIEMKEAISGKVGP